MRIVEQMAASDVSIEANRVSTKSVTLILPCGGRRRMYVEEYRKLIERMRASLEWLDGSDERKTF